MRAVRGALKGLEAYLPRISLNGLFRGRSHNLRYSDGK